MSTWTLQHGETTQTLAEWGFENCILTDKGWAPGTFQFTHSGAAFDAAPVFGKDAVITLRLDDVIKFKGFITQTPAHTGASEDKSYVAENLLGDMARRVYGQVWQNLSGGEIGGGISSKGVLFDNDGAAQQVSLCLEAIVNAAASAGVDVQFGSAVNLAVSPRKIDVKSMTFVEVLRAACVYSPDVVPQVDYSEDPPKLHFIRRGDAFAHELPVIGAADDFSIAPHYDQQIEGVYLVYETRGTSAGKSYLSLSYDVYPPGTSATGRRVLFAVQTLQGASLAIAQQQTQSIVCATVTEDDLEWWKTRVPYLRDASEGSVISDITVTDEDGTEVTVAKELRSGVVYPWMGGTTKVVFIRCIFNGLINGSLVLNQYITIRMVSTTLGTGDYENTVPATGGSTPDELPPAGVALHMYSALNPLQWSGTRTLIAQECAANIRAGDVANFPGTANAAWATARAQIQEVESNIDSGTTRIAFGRPEYLAPTDYTELLRDQRKLREGNSSGTKNTGEAGDSTTVTSDGPTWAADTSVQLGVPEEVHPFKITRIGLTGNLYRVEAGTYSGVAIPAQTVDIGAPRPLYVYIGADWTVTTWADKFGASAALTGTPALASSTDPIDTIVTIPAGVSTAKHLIGIIAAGDVVSQLERANLLPTWKDNGTQTGSVTLVSVA